MSYEDMTAGELARTMNEVREKKREYDRLAKEEGKKYEAMQAILAEKLDQMGVDKINIDGISISLVDQDLPQVVDWEALSDFILSNQYLHLLQRRVSSTAFRELLAANGEVPGVDVWTKRTVNMRVSS